MNILDENNLLALLIKQQQLVNKSSAKYSFYKKGNPGYEKIY